MTEHNLKPERQSRPFYFGSIGLLGCLLGAILGEVFLFYTRGELVESSAVQLEGLDIVMCVDTSGSMQGKRLVDMKNAMTEVINLIGPTDNLAIVSFNFSSNIIRNLTNDKSSLLQGVESLEANGLTFVSKGLLQSRDILLSARTNKRQPCILFFSDGIPTDSASQSISIMGSMRKKGIVSLAIGAYEAKLDYLEHLVGQGNVIQAIDGNLLDAFRKAVYTLQDITTKQFMANEPNRQLTGRQRLVRACGWSVLLTVCTILFLLMAQNIAMGNSYLSFKQLIFIIIGGGLCGIVSGFATQFLFEISVDSIDGIASVISFFARWMAIISGIACVIAIKKSNRTENKENIIVSCLALLIGIAILWIFKPDGIFVSNGEAIFRFLSWIIWGWVITNAIGIAFPNYDRKNALWAGAVGGAVANIVFVISKAFLAEMGGRLIGGSCLGGAVGILVGILLESKISGNNNIVTVYDKVTGKTFISNVGSDTIKMAGRMDGGVTVSVNSDNQISVTDSSGQNATLNSGEKSNIGRFQIYSGLPEVCDDDLDTPSPIQRPALPKKEEHLKDTNNNTQNIDSAITFGGKVFPILTENSEAGYETLQLLLQAMSIRDGLPKEINVVIPEKLKKLSENSLSQLRTYFNNPNNHALLFTVRQNSWFSKERIDFISLRHLDKNIKVTFSKFILYMQGKSVINMKNNSFLKNDIVNTIRQLFDNDKIICDVFIIKDNEFQAEYFNDNIIEKTRRENPGLGRSGLLRIMTDNALNSCELKNTFNDYGNQVFFHIATTQDISREISKFINNK